MRIRMENECSKYVQATYYVVETDVTGETKITYQAESGSETATASQAALTTGTITICNRDYESDIDVLKVEESTRGTATEKRLQGAEFSLQRKNDGTYTAYPDGNNTQTAGTNGKLTFSKLPDGEYMMSLLP